MSIYVHHYCLQSKALLNSQAASTERHGVLLNIDGGYACLHPWPELGDLQLDALLNDITGDRKSALVQRALYCAKIDREAREKQVSLFHGLSIPRSHATLPSLDLKMLESAIEAGFDVVKIKGGRDLAAEADFLNDASSMYPKIRWRIDFNHSHRFETIDQWRADLSSSLQKNIDFCEDAFAIDETPAANWLAIDRLVDQWHFKDEVAVIKPALNDVDAVMRKSHMAARVVLTSYMDHPVGQMFAAYEAARLVLNAPENVDVCGLVTQHLWESDAFIEQMPLWNPYLVPLAGNGLGFDELLNAISWKRLK